MRDGEEGEEEEGEEEGEELTVRDFSGGSFLALFISPCYLLFQDLRMT